MALRKDKRVSHAPWRPDFRDADLLPDVKLVRTQFLTNFLTLAAAVALLGWVLFNEFNVNLAKSELSEVRSQVAALQADNATLVRLSGDFTREARQIEQLNQFVDQPYAFNRLLVSVAEIRPRLATFNILSSGAYAERQGRQEVPRYRLQLQGTVRETAESPAAATINSFRDRLATLPEIAPKLEEQRLASFHRSEDPAVFNFNVQIVLDPRKPSDS